MCVCVCVQEFIVRTCMVMRFSHTCCTVKCAFSVLVEHKIAGTQKEAAKMMEYLCTVGHAHIGSRGEGAKRQLVYEITTVWRRGSEQAHVLQCHC